MPKDIEPSWRADKRTTTARGYGSRWQKAREGFLRSNPLCVMCRDENRVTAANVVDHIKPHRGDHFLFWDRANWAPLCKSHHDSDKQMAEKSGDVRAKFTPDGRVVW